VRKAKKYKCGKQNVQVWKAHTENILKISMLQIKVGSRDYIYENIKWYKILEKILRFFSKIFEIIFIFDRNFLFDFSPDKAAPFLPPSWIQSFPPKSNKLIFSNLLLESLEMERVKT